MIKSYILIFCLVSCLRSFGGNDIDYQNKRLINCLKKENISGYSQLEELKYNSEKEGELNGKFFIVNEFSGRSNVKYIFVGRVNSCRIGGCSIPGRPDENIDSEYFDYFIFFDSLKTVMLVEVYNYQATHGYEITAKGWLKQFVGFSSKDTLIVNKNIDGISGATVSVFAITRDVQTKSEILKTLQ